MGPRVLIFGTGGIGSVYAYLAQKGGAHVTTVCRSNYSIVQSEGIHIDSATFGKVQLKPDSVVRDVTEAAAQGQYEFVICCNKVFPDEEKQIAPAVSSHTAIALFQNGIAIEEPYAKAYPNHTIISGVVYLPATQISPGVVQMQALNRLELGAYRSSKTTSLSATAVEQTQKLVDLFHNVEGTEAVYCPDIQEQRWSKILVNASWNPICALCRLNDADVLLSNPDEAESTVRDVMREILSIAHANGYTALTNSTIETHLDRARQRIKTGDKKEPSMLGDVRNNRPMEVEALVGNTLRIARDVGVDTPMLRTIYLLVKALNYSIARDNRL